MAIRIIDLFTNVRTILADPNGARWSSLELQIWLNAGYREIVNIRPDSNTKLGVYNCSEGVRQDIATQFPSAILLIDIIRNVGGLSNKYSIEYGNLEDIDSQRRGWMNDTSSNSIEKYFFDPRLFTQFLVYPPASGANAQLEISYCDAAPVSTLTAAQLASPTTNNTIQLSDSYGNTLMDYILYRCFEKDAGIDGNAQRALAAYNAFKQSLTEKTQSDASVNEGM